MDTLSKLMTIPPRTPIGLERPKVLDFLKSYHKEHDRLPTAKVICRQFGLRSLTAAYWHVRKLAEEGKLEKDGRHYRFPKNAPQIASGASLPQGYPRPQKPSKRPTTQGNGQ